MNAGAVSSARRHLLLLLFLGGCGFQLRGGYPLPFDTLYIGLPAASELHSVLKRAIAVGSSTRVVDAQKEALAILVITGDAQAKNLLTVSAAGQAQEYELVRTFGFRLVDQGGRDWLAASQIVLRRTISVNSSQVLSKEAEEVLLWRDMQNDLIQQLLRRLATAKAPS